MGGKSTGIQPDPLRLPSSSVAHHLPNDSSSLLYNPAVTTNSNRHTLWMCVWHGVERCWRCCAQGGRCWLMSRGGLYHFPVAFHCLPPCCFLLTLQGNLVPSQLSQHFPFLSPAPLCCQLHFNLGFRLVINLHNLNPMANPNCNNRIYSLRFFIMCCAHTVVKNLNCRSLSSSTRHC